MHSVRSLPTFVNVETDEVVLPQVKRTDLDMQTHQVGFFRRLATVMSDHKAAAYLSTHVP